MLNIFKKSQAKGKEVKFKIDGMHCTSCSLNIDGSLEDLDGVLDTSTSYAKSITTITFDPEKTTEDKLIKAIKETGYEASLLN